MPLTVEDRLAIADLMTGWIHRDLAEWDKLRALFHPDGRIEITWFEGKFSEFVDASMRMGASDLHTKHLVTWPSLTFNAGKVIAETNVTVVGDNAKLGVGCAVHARFYDRVEQRDGVWGVVDRRAIYDMGSFIFPVGLMELDAATIARYPREYAPLAYLLEKSGFPVPHVFPTKGSAMEREMKAAATAWLAS